MGSSMPAVELVKVGSAYYVQDGHHRISVAHSLGQEAIEARIVN
jgi:ParB-like chromosome segregation protein Spo0J